MSKCILKGIHTDSIDKTDYSSIKQCYQRWIAALLKKGFSLDSIRIYFDDENRQIHLDHEPDEIDAMILYAEYEDKLQEHFTQFPFCEAWGGHRYCLWHNKSFEKYLSYIHHSCDIYTELSKKEYLPEKWQFSQKDHGYLSISERKAKIKQSLYELRKQGNQHQGIFINEIHHHQFPKRFIKENLDYFKELGIKTLFFEFLFYERHQLLLDEYFCSEHDELPPELACYLNFKDKASGCGFSGYTDIVKAAKKAGIRIVALDSYASILTTTRTFQAHFHHGSSEKF
ncbi:hypothetical protein E3983_01250 [Legionella israelensis]|uniref:Uncharacterized protein n=1 Tax=Legionella israelensis TaxID=454 RepID=A0AAX1EDP5_9GAMM|nr:hypothetical protein [Legionella israelensis]QBR83102.1 hypothetical protein E3983_01250 [Legionella israelensis]